MKKRRNEINYIRNKSGWNSNSQTSEKRSSSRASSRLEGKLEIEDGNPDRFIYHTFVQFRGIWKFHIVKKLFIVSRESEYQTYTVLIRIFRLLGPRGPARGQARGQARGSRASSRLRMEIQTGLSITHLFSFVAFENFTLWKNYSSCHGNRNIKHIQS